MSDSGKFASVACVALRNRTPAEIERCRRAVVERIAAYADASTLRHVRRVFVDDLLVVAGRCCECGDPECDDALVTEVQRVHGLADRARWQAAAS